MYSTILRPSKHHATPSVDRFAIIFNRATGDTLPRTTPLPRNTRLKLVLDLDNTLLHAVAQSKLRLDLKTNDFLDENGLAELFCFTMQSTPNQFFYLKLRPFVRDMLDRLKEAYQLSVHTNASREYADVVCLYLENNKQGELFSDRVVARVVNTIDANKMIRKDMSRLFGESYSKNDLLILDDRSDVWDDDLRNNLIKCYPYLYLDQQKPLLVKRYPALRFKEDKVGKGNDDISSFLDLTASFKPDVDVEGTNDNDIYDIDCQLPFITDFLLRISKKYVIEVDKSVVDPVDLGIDRPVDVKRIINEELHSILSGCYIYLRGFNKQIARRTLPGVPSSAYNLFAAVAETLGGVVVTDINYPKVTHIVSLRSNKAFAEYRARGIQIVSALWLQACFTFNVRVPESVFPYNHRLLKVSSFDVFRAMTTYIVRRTPDTDISWIPNCIIDRYDKMYKKRETNSVDSIETIPKETIQEKCDTRAKEDANIDDKNGANVYTETEDDEFMNGKDDLNNDFVNDVEDDNSGIIDDIDMQQVYLNDTENDNNDFVNEIQDDPNDDVQDTGTYYQVGAEVDSSTNEDIDMDQPNKEDPDDKDTGEVDDVDDTNDPSQDGNITAWPQKRLHSEDDVKSKRVLIDRES